MRLLSKLADGSAGDGASAHREDDFRRVSMEHTASREIAVSTAVRSPKGVSLAGAGESLLTRKLGSFGTACFIKPRQGRANASTEATLSCSSTVEFGKRSID